MNLALPFPLPLSPTQLADRLGCGDGLALSLVRLPDLRAALACDALTAAQQLTPAELVRYDGYRFEKRRLEWLGGRLAAKQAAAQLLPGSTPAEWQVDNQSDGRPFFHPVPGCRLIPSLSISHSQGLAGAMVNTHPCGLDLQRVSDSVIRIRERFCLEAEVELLHSAGVKPTSEAALLTMLWAAKEALRKGLGGQPLPGFLALHLVRVDRIEGQARIFTMQAAGGLVSEHLVAAWWLEDFAVALTVLNR